MKITYNAPVVLTFTFGAVAVLIAGTMTGGSITRDFFTVGTTMRLSSPVDWWQLIGHVLGHADASHLVGNLAFILLLGPGLEEKYGSLNLLEMLVITALITGAVTVLFLPTGLLGASGIVFMMILLGSFANAREGELPLTFILVALLYLGRECVAAFRDDSISQLAHILGGACGAGFGLLRARNPQG